MGIHVQFKTDLQQGPVGKMGETLKCYIKVIVLRHIYAKLSIDVVYVKGFNSRL